MTPDPKVRSRPPQSASGKSGRIGNDKRTCTRWSNPHRKAAKLKRSTQATRPSHGSRAPLSKAKAEGCRNTEVRKRPLRRSSMEAIVRIALSVQRALQALSRRRYTDLG